MAHSQAPGDTSRPALDTMHEVVLGALSGARPDKQVEEMTRRLIG
jgi:hypothetical protein